MHVSHLATLETYFQVWQGEMCWWHLNVLMKGLFTRMTFSGFGAWMDEVWRTYSETYLTPCLSSLTVCIVVICYVVGWCWSVSKHVVYWMCSEEKWSKPLSLEHKCQNKDNSLLTVPAKVKITFVHQRARIRAWKDVAYGLMIATFLSTRGQYNIIHLMYIIQKGPLVRRHSCIKQ